jgi:fatty-acid desaturase
MTPLAGYRGTGPPATPKRWLRRALLDWVIIILCFRAAHWSLFETTSLLLRVATLVPLVVVIAARQHALGILAHDGAHRLICRSHFLNDFLANFLCEWPLMSNLGGYRAFHFEHHRKVGTPEDPELIYKNNQWRISQHTCAGAVAGSDSPLEVCALYRRRLRWCCSSSSPHGGPFDPPPELALI